MYNRCVQHIWKLEFHADTATIFSQMNKTLKITMAWLVWMASCYSFHKMFSPKSAYPEIQWAPGKEISRFLNTVTSYKSFLGNFHRKISMICFQKKSLCPTI